MYTVLLEVRNMLFLSIPKKQHQERFKIYSCFWKLRNLFFLAGLPGIFVRSSLVHVTVSFPCSLQLLIPSKRRGSFMTTWSCSHLGIFAATRVCYILHRRPVGPQDVHLTQSFQLQPIMMALWLLRTAGHKFLTGSFRSALRLSLLLKASSCPF